MRFSQFLPAIAWFLLSLVLLCLPGSTLPTYPWLALIHADKWVHIFLFGTLCFLFGRPLRNSAVPTAEINRWLLMISVAGVFYGTAMEFVQEYWVPNRSFELADIGADSVGCVVGYFAARWWVLKKIGPDRNRDRNQN